MEGCFAGVRLHLFSCYVDMVHTEFIGLEMRSFVYRYDILFAHALSLDLDAREGTGHAANSSPGLGARRRSSS